MSSQLAEFSFEVLAVLELHLQCDAKQIYRCDHLRVCFPAAQSLSSQQHQRHQAFTLGGKRGVSQHNSMARKPSLQRRVFLLWLESQRFAEACVFCLWLESQTSEKAIYTRLSLPDHLKRAGWVGKERPAMDRCSRIRIGPVIGSTSTSSPWSPIHFA